MRRRPPAQATLQAARLAGEALADEQINELVAALRLADPVDGGLEARLVALEGAAILAAGGDAANALAAVVAARQAAERVAGEEGADLLDRVRCGDIMVNQLISALRPAAAPAPTHH